MHMLDICRIYTSSRFNSYSIKLVTLRLYNYNSLEKLIIGRVGKPSIKRLNVAALDTASTPMRICSVYAPYMTGLSLNRLTTSESVVVVYTR
jgi:hypothetical protein